MNPRDDDGKFTEKGSVDESDDDKKLSNQDLKAKCFSEVSSKKNMIIKNSDKGDNIRISQTGIKEWKTKSKSREQIVSIRKIDYLLENGKYSHSSEDKKHRKHVLGFDYYVCPIKVNKKDFDAVITIKKTDNAGNLYYHHFLRDKK